MADEHETQNEQPEPKVYKARRAEKTQRFQLTLADGEQRELTADEHGLITPTSDEEEAGLDLFGVPVARVPENKPATTSVQKAGPKTEGKD